MNGRFYLTYCQHSFINQSSKGSGETCCFGDFESIWGFHKLDETGITVIREFAAKKISVTKWYLKWGFNWWLLIIYIKNNTEKLYFILRTCQCHLIFPIHWIMVLIFKGFKHNTYQWYYFTLNMSTRFSNFMPRPSQFVFHLPSNRRSLQLYITRRRKWRLL